MLPWYECVFQFKNQIKSKSESKDSLLLTIVVKSTAVLGFLSTVAMCVIQYYLRSSYVVGNFFATNGALKELLKGGVELGGEATRLILINLALAALAGLPFFILCYSGSDFSSYVTVYSKEGYDGGMYEDHRSGDHLHIAQFIIIGALIIIPLVAFSATPIIYFIPALYSVFLLFSLGKKVYIPVVSVLAAAAVILTVFSLSFDPEDTPRKATEGLVFEINEDGKSYSVISYGGEDIEIYIPEKHEGMPVTEIGDSAFLENTTVTEIYIPKTLKRIGASAFENCASLSLVKFLGESSLKIIDTAAFRKCEFVSFTLPSSVEEIGDDAFYCCTKLKAFGIEEDSSLKKIGNRSFLGCNALLEFYFPEGLESIGEDGFNSCDGLLSVNLPHSVTHVGSEAFAFCYSLEAATIGNGVTELNSTFSRCNRLKTVTLGTGITVFDSAFIFCDYLESVSLPITEGWVDKNGREIPSEYLSNPKTAVGYLSRTAYVTRP